MSTLSILSGDWNISYVLAKVAGAGVTNHYGYSLEEDGFHFRYRAEDFDAVQAVIDAYPTQYADEMLRDQLIAEVTEARWEKQQHMTYGGKTVPADDSTITRISAAVQLMKDLPESPQTRRWKTGPNAEDWVTLDRDALLAMGAAIADHVQACFDHEESLHSQLRAAATVDELNAIDISVGWPN